MVRVNYDDLSLALDFVSAAASFENRAYISRDTGVIYWLSEEQGLEQEQLPEDLETSDRYIEIPHKNDLDLGHELVRRFVDEHLAHRREEVDDVFRRRGAYARFKDLLAAEGCLEKWYAYEARAQCQALRDWCQEHDFHLDQPPPK